MRDIILYMKKAVLCFVISGEEVLMINRNKPPFMGLWNAVGGKVKDGEDIFTASKREIFEESGISVNHAELLSSFTWNYDDEQGYATITRLLENDFNRKDFPKLTEEGIVDFKPIDWVLNAKNYGVIEDLRVFIGDIKNGRKRDYHLVYDGKNLIEVIVK